MDLQQVGLALACNPSLKELSINISHFFPRHPIPDISGFKNLYSLHIVMEHDCLSNIPNGFMRSSLLVVAASPMLRSLHLITKNPYNGGNFDTLVDVSNICSPETLQDLKSVGVPIQLSLDHGLENLKHLTLTHGSCDDLQSWSTKYGTAWADIWNALYDAGSKKNLWLETLDTEGVQPECSVAALFRYLACHPGLKKLYIRRPAHDKQLQSEPHEDYGNEEELYELLEADDNQNRQWATQFWCEIIPRHSHSLRELSVVPLEQGPWSYGQNASTAIRQCFLLRKLEISVSDVDGDWALDKAANFEMADWRPVSTLKGDVPSDLDPYLKDISWLDNVIWGQLPTCPVGSRAHELLYRNF